MKKCLLLALLIALSCLLARGQSDFRTGFIIYPEKDTVWGEVAYRSNTRNEKAGRFRKNGETRDYNPRELFGFGYLNDKAYVSNIVDDVFVEVLVSGEVSLYKDGGVYYAQKKEGEIVKLERTYMKAVTKGGMEMQREDFRWMGLLKAFLVDCPLAQINSIKFTERDLTDIIANYNICKSASFVVYKKNKPWSKVRVGLSSGVVYSHIHARFKSTVLDYLPSEGLTSVDPYVGLQFEISSPRVSERFSFLADIQFTKVDYSTLVATGTQNNFYYYDTDIRLSTLSVPLMVRYSFQSKKYIPYLMGGFWYDHHFSGTAKVIREHVAFNTVSTSTGNAFEVQKRGVGFAGGAGITRTISQKVRAGVFVRYVQGDKLNRDQSTEMSVRNNRLFFSLILQLQ